jgi:hypothetical protein
MLTVQLEIGDCGSWVLDSTSGDWVGHVVAGKIGTEMAYIALARDIVKDISDQLGVQNVQMRNETEFGTQIVDDLKGTLPIPEKLEVQERRSQSGASCKLHSENASSGLVHGDDVEGGLIHYSGCLKFSEREEFLHSLHEDDRLKLHILKEQTRIARLRKIFEQEGLATTNGRLVRSFRQTLAQQFPGRRSYSHLHTPEIRRAEYPTSNTNIIEDQVILSDLTANVVYFKGDQDAYPRPYDHPALDNTFPNQKVPLSLLLSQSRENPLTWKCEENMVRYFHVPSNNM